MKRKSSCWDRLPIDILQSVTERLNYGDRVRLSAVCESWRTIVKKLDICAPPRVPWLLFHDDQTIDSHLRFYDPSEGRLYNITLNEQLQGGYIWGSCKGWVLMPQGRKCSYLRGLQFAKLFSVDPISRVCFRLHDINRIAYRNDTHEVKKIELSSGREP